MKPIQYLISGTMAFTIAFIGCTGTSSDTTATTSADSAAATMTSADDASQQKLEENKKFVTEFYQALYGDKDSNAIDKYIADNVIMHNPLAKDGKEWLKNTLRPFLENPNIEKVKVDIKHIAADGDKVWLYVRDVAPNKRVFARVNIFRVENGKIAEAWKISEEVPKESENTNTMF